MEIRLGGAARARSLPLPYCHWVRGWRCNPTASEGSAAAAAAAAGGARSPAPGEEPYAGERAGVRAQTPGSSGSGLGAGP